jgi:two-component system KDP operon response regulator KdpE
MNKPGILVIDDEPQMRKLLSIALESNGYAVLLASSGAEGIRMTTQYNPDLILLDIGLLIPTVIRATGIKNLVRESL